jgi:hypothetical protein
VTQSSISRVLHRVTLYEASAFCACGRYPPPKKKKKKRKPTDWPSKELLPYTNEHTRQTTRSASPTPFCVNQMLCFFTSFSVLSFPFTFSFCVPCVSVVSCDLYFRVSMHQRMLLSVFGSIEFLHYYNTRVFVFKQTRTHIQTVKKQP